MKIFAEVNVLRGAVTWTRPFRPRYSPPSVAAVEDLAPAREYDEDGRLYVFRYANAVPQRYSIERDRIFDYLKKRRLPNARQRQVRRDLRNAADFFADVRELQTCSEVEEA